MNPGLRSNRPLVLKQSECHHHPADCMKFFRRLQKGKRKRVTKCEGSYLRHITFAKGRRNQAWVVTVGSRRL